MTTARIMIVEDERITAEDLRDILEEQGYIVTAVVATGAEAIREAERTKPELALMDLRLMGDMDGADCARILRERFDIPAIFLTAYADPASLQRARVSEPMGYLVKPFQESEIRASIEMALHRRQSERVASASSRLLSATLRAMGEGVICANADGIVTFLNEAAERWTGWPADRARGEPLQNVFRISSPTGGANLQELLETVSRDGSLVELDVGVSLIARDSSERPVGGSLAPLRNPEGAIDGTVVVFGSPRHEPAPGREAGPVDHDDEESKALASVGMLAESPAMRRLIRYAHRVAASEVSTILLEGESGTGKDLLARLIHNWSRRSSGPLITINCAAIPEALLESELFGYEKGAFTDARARKKGILELAHGGTVFLDEVGELPMALQAKLLRVLEQQRFRRLGGLDDIVVDVRIIAATNQDLRECVRQGKFRLDLYYRLNVIPMLVPPLRERTEEILSLANYFIRIYDEKFGLQVKGISAGASRALLAYDWPGNIRELRNAIERAMVLEESDQLQAAYLGITHERPELLRSTTGGASSILDGLSLEEAERLLLTRAMERSRGNQTRAAQMLGISRDAMRYKIKKFKLESVGLLDR